jgi:hypothetical protein
MRGRPFLRAYMAGVLLPTWFLPIMLAAFLTAHFTRQVPAGLERALTFPMAVAPNVWVIWNALYLGSDCASEFRSVSLARYSRSCWFRPGVALAAALDLLARQRRRVTRATPAEEQK